MVRQFSFYWNSKVGVQNDTKISNISYKSTLNYACGILVEEFLVRYQNIHASSLTLIFTLNLTSSSRKFVFKSICGFKHSQLQRVSIYFFTETFYFQKAKHRECEACEIYNDVNLRMHFSLHFYSTQNML